MEAREKRIDLRLGAFACSLRGFDDPLPALTRILHELRAVQEAVPENGRPLFDAATLERLEAELVIASGGGVSAVPGLVLTLDGEAQEAAPEEPASEARELAMPDPEAALAALRNAFDPRADAELPEEDAEDAEPAIAGGDAEAEPPQETPAETPGPDGTAAPAEPVESAADDGEEAREPPAAGGDAPSAPENPDGDEAPPASGPSGDADAAAEASDEPEAAGPETAAMPDEPAEPVSQPPAEQAEQAEQEYTGVADAKPFDADDKADDRAEDETPFSDPEAPERAREPFSGPVEAERDEKAGASDNLFSADTGEDEGGVDATPLADSAAEAPDAVSEPATAEQGGSDREGDGNLFASDVMSDAAGGSVAEGLSADPAHEVPEEAPDPDPDPAPFAATPDDPAEEADGNLFAPDAGPGAAEDYSDENLFGDPDPSAESTSAAGENAAEDEPGSLARNAPEAEPEMAGPEMAGPEVSPPDPEAVTGGGSEANFFDPSVEEDAEAVNLFDDPAEDAAAAAPAAEAPDDDASIAPGSFRKLERFAPGAAAQPDKEEEAEEAELPPLRDYDPVSAEEFADRAKATAPADLMAAMAAWLIVVKGHGSFSKREVLELYEALPGDHPRTAEARVKGFGRLVRNGQIMLGDDQRFRLSEAERDRFEALLD